MNPDDHIDSPKSYPKGRPVRFGFIGRITDTKGIDILLKAVKLLQTENWELKIAGKGNVDYIVQLKDIYKDNRIEFLGFTDPDAFYESIDVLICPSVYGEPLPRVVYEAYRAALPVIVSDRGGTPEIVDHGKNGFVYEGRDYKTLAVHMDTLASEPDLYDAMSAASAEKAKIFTCSHIVSEFTEQLEKVIGK